jgi:heat shock protein HslJ
VLVVGDIASTQVACEPAALMDLDTWLSSLLTSDPTVVVEGDTLTLTEGQSAITLTAAS